MGNLIKCFLLLFITMTSVLACGNQLAKETTNDDQYNSHNASWLAGSWGVTQRIDGGYKLDKTVNTSDWVSGAKEIVKNLPSTSHVITSFTHPAHAYLFTLRDNNNLDVAAIHPDMVPSIENEHIIFDVIKEYRRAGKKVILYLNAAGPSMITDTDPDNERAIKKAWEGYYNSQWNGNEGAAWRDLVLGYAQRFNGLVDGYWLDNVNKLPGKVSDFVAMLRSVDSTLAITVNKTKTYFKNESDDFIYVNSDSIDDKDERDYKIIKYAATNKFEDFTSGHITPLGRGAPPNSWAYEEYTIPDMVSAPWDNYKGKNSVLKHAWFPIRARWSVAKTELIFEIEQAYRFTRKITDAGAAMTWSTTQKNGYMSIDEMEIMLEIENRINKNQSYEAYERPNGASLLENN
ncbi:hypothetical protein NRL14_14475 [Pseudoalteromonas sp. 20-92]|uniref:hypothetical protein n=1 Tax=Pseudoalteromonas sp. 20-92 TaxID=2969394 RepID=UPI0027B24BA5|nr:hypothetical protein [Pseudoalteromonas sp. 20-92]MDQ2044939.1 hypothetical protein [Pseudoalteromonas sp. 20-92]